MKNKFSFKNLSLPKFSFKLTEEKKKDMIASSIVMSVVLVVMTVIIALCANLLSGFPQKSREREALGVMNRIMPAERYEKSTFSFDAAAKITALYEAKNGDELVGYCVETEADGYENPIRLMVALDPSGAVTRVEIISIDETIGYNNRVDNEEFLNRFVGKNQELTIVKSNTTDAPTKIVAVSGATVSASGVKDGVNHAIAAVSQVRAAAEQARIAAEREEQERLAAEKAEQERIAAEQATAAETEEEKEAA